MKCSSCGKEFNQETKDGRIASIAGSIMGDEYIDSYYFCVACNVYTKEHNRDSFTGGESGSITGPIQKADGDFQVELIQQCSDPMDKKCRCEAHVKYFGSGLD